MDINGDGQTDVGELLALYGFAKFAQQRASQARNRKLAAMSDWERDNYLATEWFENRLRQHLGMRTREMNSVRKLLNAVAEERQLSAPEICDYWLLEGERYWYTGGREQWHRRRM